VYAIGESDLPADDMAGPDKRFLARLASLIDPTLSENKKYFNFFPWSCRENGLEPPLLVEAVFS
jgi:hypothetical protein